MKSYCIEPRIGARSVCRRAAVLFLIFCGVVTLRADLSGLGSPPSAMAISFGRETRRTLQEAPQSALDATRALAAANAIASYVPGARVYAVGATGSMRPVFSEKAFLVVEPAPYEQLKIGDIIIYRHPQFQSPVVHRILEKHADGYWTKGDYCDRPDNVYVTPENYVMRVFAIIYAREDSRVAADGAMWLKAPALN